MRLGKTLDSVIVAERRFDPLLPVSNTVFLLSLRGRWARTRSEGGAHVKNSMIVSVSSKKNPPSTPSGHLPRKQGRTKGRGINVVAVSGFALLVAYAMGKYIGMMLVGGN
ncbi:hypothetical protein MNBD_ALPHA06-1950 [hydrothermal vent metagenome]|uniref:Uncharacterized protein n=1 Tax=hydrothermal vent metagenome TaxID=652676 RepID=A0A3B0RES4_9ZZZZ